jgi:hypothetical protein
MQTVTATEEPDHKSPPPTHLQLYFHRIAWEQNQFTNSRLEIMLEASCIRFLGHLEDCDFVLGLAEAIRIKQKHMSRELDSATTILHYLAEKIKTKSSMLTDENSIENLIYIAQEILAKRQTVKINDL